MADRMAAEIRIGGKISLDIVPELCGAISLANAGLECGDCGLRPNSADDLVSALVDDDNRVLLILRDDEARWGEFEEFEEFLRQHGIGYDRLSEGRYDCSPEIVHFRPGSEPTTLLTTPNHQPIVLAESLAEVERQMAQVINRLRQGRTTTMLRSLEDIQNGLRQLLPPEIPPLERFEIVNP